MANRKSTLPKKWLTNVSPSSSLPKAAKEILRLRSAAVLHHLPLAANQALDDPEHVHQLRVATRRAGAALKAVRSVLPKKQTRQTKKLLRRIRRACGPARDLDVMRIRLEAQDELPAESRSRIAVALASRRNLAEPELQATLRNYSKDDVREQFEVMIRKTKWRRDGIPERWSDRAADVLLTAAQRMQRASQFLEKPDVNLSKSIDEVHQLRIRGKRLRYSMEIVIGAFGDPLRELYRFSASLQQQLGTINDHAVAEKFYSEWRGRTSDTGLREDLAAIIDCEHSSLQAALDDFGQGWSGESVQDFWQALEDIIQRSDTTNSASRSIYKQRKGA